MTIAAVCVLLVCGFGLLNSVAPGCEQVFVE